MITWSYSLLSNDSSGASLANSSDVEINKSTFVELAIDPLTGDMHTQPFLARGPDATVQRLRTRFQFFKAEWFLDKRLGIPYREFILIKNPNMILISFIFRQVLVTTPGVASVARFTAVIDSVARHLISDFEATLSDGTVLRADAEPFVLR